MVTMGENKLKTS